MKKILNVILVVILLLSCFSLGASAKTVSYVPYDGYEYSNDDESVAAPVAYVMDKVYSGFDLGLKEDLDAPSDITYFGNCLYVLDSGNGRIIKLNSNMETEQIYDRFIDKDGGEISIKNAQGFTLDNSGKYFYIANTDFFEVIKVDLQGNVLMHITRPDDILQDTDMKFKVNKVIVDNKDTLYVLVEGINLGAFVFDQQGEFQTFFGSNPVTTTSQMISDYFWKRFMTEEQRKGLLKVTSTMFTNFDVDEYGFIYTVTAETNIIAKTGTVRRLNYTGNDILKDGLLFGDREWDRGYDDAMYTILSDIDIDSEGYINLLDTGRGKVFQYTADGEQIAVFGSYNEQYGGFLNPVAIETIGNKVFVLDAGKKEIIAFVPTEYGGGLRKAFALLNTTKTDESFEAWSDLLAMNTNSLYPYYGLGRVYDSKGEYKKAMDMFELAGAKEEYSKALREYRRDYIDSHYLLLILIIAAVITVIIVASKLLKKKTALIDNTAYSGLESKYLFPIYTMLHPADGFGQFKNRKNYSLLLSFVFVLAWFFIRTAEYFATGFVFNNNTAEDYRFIVMVAVTFGLFILFAVANWSMCTLFNGKGTLAEIISTTAYSLLPYLASKLICLVLSNILTLEESVFISLISFIGLLWTGLILFIGLQSIHHYSVLKTVGSLLLTVFAMAVILLVLVLFFTLVQQAYNYVDSVFMEMSLR